MVNLRVLTLTTHCSNNIVIHLDWQTRHSKTTLHLGGFSSVNYGEQTANLHTTSASVSTVGGEWEGGGRGVGGEWEGGGRGVGVAYSI